jgi:hypothetical protein
VAGETTDAYDERQRIAGLLLHWAQTMPTDFWPGVQPTHRALLLMLVDVFDGPRTHPPIAWTQGVK